MEAQNTNQNYNSSLPPVNNDRLKYVIRFYSFKLHFIAVPIGLILAIIHFKFAFQYFGQCPIQPMINIYMIVHAAVHLLLLLLTLIGVINIHFIYPRFQYHHQIVPRIILIIVLVSTLISVLFSLAWVIAGSVWVFGAKTNGVQGTDPSDTATYCQSHLYKAAFTLLIVNYVFHGLILLIFIGGYIRRKRQNKTQSALVLNSMVNRI